MYFIFFCRSRALLVVMIWILLVHMVICVKWIARDHGLN